VNSTSSDAAHQSGSSGTIVAPAINVVGGSSLNATNVVMGAKPMADPLAGLQPPDPATLTNRGGNARFSKDKTIDPGYYPSGIATTGGTLTLKRGVYYLGGDFKISGTGSYLTDNGQGVLIYMAPNTTLSLSGGGGINLSALDTGPWSGVTIWQDRLGTNTASIGGGSALNITGTLYFPSSELDVNGSGSSLANQIITNSLVNIGSTAVYVNYDGRNNPGSPRMLVPVVAQ